MSEDKKFAKDDTNEEDFSDFLISEDIEFEESIDMKDENENNFQVQNHKYSLKALRK